MLLQNNEISTKMSFLRKQETDNNHPVSNIRYPNLNIAHRMK